MNQVLPFVLIFGLTWAAVTTLRIAAAFALGAYRGITRRFEPAAITSMIFGAPAIANVAVAAAVTAPIWSVWTLSL